MKPDAQLIERTKRRMDSEDAEGAAALQVRLDRYAEACKLAFGDKTWEQTAKDRATNLRRLLDEGRHHGS